MLALQVSSFSNVGALIAAVFSTVSLLTTTATAELSKCCLDLLLNLLFVLLRRSWGRSRTVAATLAALTARTTILLTGSTGTVATLAALTARTTILLTGSAGTVATLATLIALTGTWLALTTTLLTRSSGTIHWNALALLLRIGAEATLPNIRGSNWARTASTTAPRRIEGKFNLTEYGKTF